MNRLLIERIEGRILLGITMFVSTMILIGWVAINEPARMASFERQHLGRSIELGAELFASNCSTCHGADGRGIVGRAPGLNSPHLFGFDFLSDVNGQIGILQRQVADLDALIEEAQAERDGLVSEIAEASAERQDEIVARIAEIDELLNADVEGSLPAQIAEFQVQIDPLLAERDLQIESLFIAMDSNYLPGYDAAVAEAESEGNPLILTNYLASDADRLNQMAWGGDLRSYLTTTLIHGRPGSGNVWDGNIMAAWSQIAGGPLREDQIDDLVNYMLNWDQEEWTLEDLYAVNQFGKLKADAALAGSGASDVMVIGTNVEEATAATIALTGDPVRGEALYNGGERTEAGIRLGCSSCHLGGAQAPATELTWEVVNNERLLDPALAGYTAEQYLVESIIRPNDYVVETYASGVMPANYGDQFTAQDMADVIAYLRSYSE